MKRLFTFFILLQCMGLGAYAQLVRGVVTDSWENEPLPGVHVYYQGDPKTLARTDVNGKYQIPFRNDSLVFSMTGFQTQVLEVKKAGKLDVILQESSVSLTEVEVVSTRRRYSRKNNPAVELMKKVIAAKRQSDLRAHDYLSYMTYEKMIFSLNDLSEKTLEDDHFKRLPFLTEHIEENPKTGKLILPLTIEEKVSETIYRKSPRTEKNIITGQRNEGVNDLVNTGDIFTGILADCFTDIDIYEDEVRLLQYRFTSPISSTGAINFYRYFIVDTLQVDADSCIRVDFTPNTPQDFGFSGSLYVLADSTWRLKRAEIGVPGKTAINFIEEMSIVQDYHTLPSGEQVMKHNRMIIQLKLFSWVQQAQVEREVVYSDWDFSPIPDKKFRFKGETRQEASSQSRNDKFWDEHRPIPLTKGEQSVDLFMKHLYSTRGFKQLLWVGKAFLENYVETSINPDKPSKVDIGPINTMIGSNFVEGFRLRLSAQTTANLHPHLFLRGYGKYGFKDQRWKGLGEVTYSFNSKDYMPREYPMRNLTFSYTNDITSPSDKFLTTDRDNVFISFKWAPVTHLSYFERYNLQFDWEWENGLYFYTQARREWNEGAGDLFYQKLDGLGVPSESPADHIRKIHFTEFTAGLKFQPGATYLNTKQRRYPTNRDSPTIGLSHTLGVKGFLGGQYNYNFTEATLYKRFWFRSWGRINVMLKGGLQWNKVPFPFLIMPAANTSYFMEDNTFRLIKNMEFPTDRYASMNVSWDLNGKILNRIPLLKKLKWREYIGVNALWGKLTDKNNPLKNPTDASLLYFPGYFDDDGEFHTVSHVMDPKKPYVEVVAGFHNIFRFFHVEYVRRLNYFYPRTHKWGIRGAIEFSF